MNWKQKWKIWSKELKMKSYFSFSENKIDQIP